MNQYFQNFSYPKKNYLFQLPFYLLSLIILVTTFSCSSGKKLSKQNAELEVRNAVQQLVKCYNQRDAECLIQLFDPAYKSWSPVEQPSNISDFVKHSVSQFEQNDFEIKIDIKEINAGEQFAHAALRWTIFYKQNNTSQNPPVDVNRIDIWKKGADQHWRLYRTVIYTEKRF